MKIVEAIKRLEKVTLGLPADNEAKRLGIEALMREQVWRQNDPGDATHLLPGETED